MTQEELMAYYATAGIDPTMADMSASFYQQTTRQQGATNQQIANQATMGASPYDMGMNAQKMSLDNLTRIVEGQTRSIDRLMQHLGQQSSQTDMTIRNLAQLQQQTQAQISSQQFSLGRAQMMYPQSFPGAPGIQYQTDPGAAIYRGMLPSSLPNVAIRPQSTFMSDVMMRNDFLRRNFYEPSFAEDPFMSVYGAGKRMDERWDTIGRYAGSGAAGLTGIVAGGAAISGMAALARRGSTMAAGAEAGVNAFARRGMLSMGMSRAATRTALGFVPGIGTALTLADMGLDLAGLPSVTGTISDATMGAYNYTLGSGQVFRDSVKDIQRATSFFTGAGSGLTGQGLGARQASNVARGLRQMSVNDYVLNQNDYMGIFQNMGEQGLLSQSGSDEQMLSNVRTVSKNLRLFMRVSGDPDYKNAIKAMGELFRMGVPMNNLSGAIENVQAFSRMAGLNFQQADTFGKQGALMYQQAGASLGIGYQAGVLGRSLGRTATQSGQFSPGLLAYYGGEEGVSQRITEMQAAITGGPIMQSLTAGMLKKGKDGKLEVDRSMVQQWEAGKISIRDLQGRAQALLNQNPKLMADYMLRQRELGVAVSEEMGPQGAILTQLNIIRDIQNQNPGMGVQEATLVAFGGKSDQADIFLKTINPTTLKSMVAAEQKQRYQLQYNRNQVIQTSRQPLNRLKVGIQKFLYENVGKGFEQSARENVLRRDQQAALDMGLFPGSELSDLNTASNEKYLQRMGLSGSALQRQNTILDKIDMALEFSTIKRDPTKDDAQFEASGVQGAIDNGLFQDLYFKRSSDPQGKTVDFENARSAIRDLITQKNPDFFKGMDPRQRNSTLNMLTQRALLKASSREDLSETQKEFFAGTLQSVDAKTQADLKKVYAKYGKGTIGDYLTQTKTRGAYNARTNEYTYTTEGGLTLTTSQLGTGRQLSRELTGTLTSLMESDITGVTNRLSEQLGVTDPNFALKLLAAGEDTNKIESLRKTLSPEDQAKLKGYSAADLRKKAFMAAGNKSTDITAQLNNLTSLVGEENVSKAVTESSIKAKVDAALKEQQNAERMATGERTTSQAIQSRIKDMGLEFAISSPEKVQEDLKNKEEAGYSVDERQLNVLTEIHRTLTASLVKQEEGFLDGLLTNFNSEKPVEEAKTK